MNFRHCYATLLAVFLFCTAASAQKAEVTVSLNEAFFDAVLDSIFQHLEPLEFPIASQAVDCRESVKILRELNGVRTAIRFRQGKINVPLAFSALYDPPFIACRQITGTANAVLELDYDAEGQRVVGRVKVSSVSPAGTGGLGGSVIAKLIQSTIDEKINPIEIIRLDKLSLIVPVQNAGSLRMRATAARAEVVHGAVNLHITYEFSKP